MIGKLPENAKAEDVNAAGLETQRAVIEFGVRAETIGYMVFRGTVDLQTVDDLIGGVTTMFWSRAKDWCERDRERTTNPKSFEWCEWLVDRISERRKQLGHEPAYIRYADWRE